MQDLKLNAKDPASWIPKDIFMAYTGGSVDMGNFYDKAVSKKNINTFSFDWVAFLFLPFWLGMRRQMNMLYSLCAVFFLATVAEIAFQIALPSSSFTGALIGLSFFLRAMLLGEASKTYIKYRLQEKSDAEIKSLMQDKAAFSIPMGFLGIFLVILSSALPLIVHDLFLVGT